MYTRLGVVTTERGESFYNSRIPGAIAALRAVPGLVSEEGGAQTIFLGDVAVGSSGKRSAVNYPLFLRKSDGGYGYDSTDMAALQQRKFEMGADWVVYVTDKRQASRSALVLRRPPATTARACRFFPRSPAAPQPCIHGRRAP